MAKIKPSKPKLGKKKADETVYQGAVAVKAKPKRKKWKIVLVVAIVLVVLVAAAMIFLRGPMMMLLGRNAFSSADITVSTVQSATAETGTLSSTISATGNLAMTDTEDVTIPSDLTVDEVYVESGDSVTEGETLATLNTTSIVSALLDAEESLEDIEDQLDDDDDLSDLEIEELEGQQAELEETISALEALYDNPVITATCDGTISAVYVSDGSAASSSSSSSSGGSVYSTSAASAAPVLSLLTATTGSSEEANAVVSAASEDSSASDSSGDSSGTEDSSSTSVETITDFSELEITIPVTGDVPQSEIAETETYTGTISWNCTSGVFKAETSYTATIVLTANDGYTFSSAELPTISGAAYTWQIINEGDSGAKLRIAATFGATDADETEDTGSYSDSADSAGATSGTAGMSSGSISSGSSGSVSGSVSSGTASSGSSDSGSSGSSSSSSLYSSSDTTAFTILKQDEVTISVSIDELDILSVSEGQTATVTLDALEDEEFTGTITSVGTEATSTSGNAKYTVEITIDKTDNMLSGMSASVVIQTGSTENAVLIPVAALQEEDGSTFVYTEADEDGNLSGEVEVETGLSTSSQVEITSGLSEGDTVYYNVTESDATSDEASMSDMFGGMGGGGNFDAGDFDAGDFDAGNFDVGNMPSGGRGGGQ
ncbi:MAG: HlyD family efflux transporter periplasmic adaptor subunit [Clostridiales bacterium]|nr:HlyD family efflux transporter periplasmic adaptor subunit [Clostridiales bacterium]